MPSPQPEIAAPAGLRYQALDSLRGICACMVVLYHLHPSSILTSLPIARNGWLFVDFFFVLSGFVIAASYGEKLAHGFGIARFMGLRLGRVYPLHLFVLLLFVLVQLAAGEPRFVGEFSLPDLGLNLLLLQSFDSADRLTWNNPAWSIAAEVWTYLVFALIASRMPARIIPSCIAMACAALFLLVFYASNQIPGDYAQGFVRCLCGFSLGVLVYHARLRWPRYPATAWEIAMVFTVIATASFADEWAICYAPLVFALAVFVFAGEGGWISHALERPVFQWLGTLSYGIYMLHIFALARFFDAIATVERATGWKLTVPGETAIQVGGGSTFDRILTELLTLGALLFVILLAWAGWRFVEMPARQWSRRRLGRASEATISG